MSQEIPQVWDWADHNCPVNWNHPANAGLVSWWTNLPCGQWGGGTKWRDLNRSRQYDGTLTSFTFSSSASPWKGPRGRAGGFGALEFAGAQYVATPSAAPFAFRLGDFTVACWFRLSLSTGGVQQFASARNNDGGTNQGFALFTDQTGGTDRLVAQLHGTGAATGATALGVGVWRHGALTRAGDLLSVYLDGRPEVSLSGVAAADVNSVIPPTFGATLGANGTFQYLNGSLDDIRIYSRALSGAQVRALYDWSRAGYPGPLRRLRQAAYYLRPPQASGPGLEHTLPDSRLRHTLPESRLHHTLPESRLHHAIPEEDAGA